MEERESVSGRVVCQVGHHLVCTPLHGVTAITVTRDLTAAAGLWSAKQCTLGFGVFGSFWRRRFESGVGNIGLVGEATSKP